MQRSRANTDDEISLQAKQNWLCESQKITNSPEKYFKIKGEIGYNTAIVVELNLLNCPYVVQIVRTTESSLKSTFLRIILQFVSIFRIAITRFR